MKRWFAASRRRRQSGFRRLAQYTSLFTGPSTGGVELLAHRGVHQTYSAKASPTTPAPPRAFIRRRMASYETPCPRWRPPSAPAPAPTSSSSTFIRPPTASSPCCMTGRWTAAQKQGRHPRAQHGRAEGAGIRLWLYGRWRQDLPFRGKGVGLMPTLDEVLARFPDRRLLINVKMQRPGRGRSAGRSPRPASAGAPRSTGGLWRRPPDRAPPGGAAGSAGDVERRPEELSCSAISAWAGAASSPMPAVTPSCCCRSTSHRGLGYPTA